MKVFEQINSVSIFKQNRTMKKMKILAVIIFSMFFSFSMYGQNKKTDVLTLGVFHFNFPNLDVQKVQNDDQIDVLEDKYQKEIKEIVEKLEIFKPTIIIIEEQSSQQKVIDSLYNLYLNEDFQLNRDEGQQIGFRLAKKLRLKKIYCGDEWGDFPENIQNVLKDPTKQNEKNEFIKYFSDNPDLDKTFHRENIYKTEGIISQLKMMNDRKIIKQSLGNYLIGPFKYEINEGDFLGTNFEIGNWFSRNLKIFRNIQRIETNDKDKILVIFGADHLNLLNLLFESSPEYNLVETNKYLK